MLIRLVDKMLRLLRPHRWPEGTPLMSGGVRWGTRLDDGTIEGAPGVRFTPLVCSRCQQAIDAEAEQNAAGKAGHHTEDGRVSVGGRDANRKVTR
jgi:hypothetical protein